MCTLRKQKASLKNREIKEVRLLSEYYSRHGMIQRRDIKGDYILSGQKDWMKSECRYPYVKEKQLAGLLSHRDYQTRKVTEQKMASAPVSGEPGTLLFPGCGDRSSSLIRVSSYCNMILVSHSFSDFCFIKKLCNKSNIQKRRLKKLA